MIGFYLLGAVALAMFAAMFIFDFGWRRGHRQGIEDGRRLATEEAFMRGVIWWSAKDDGIEGARKDLWRREIGA